jgi:hypothetical protein
MGLTVHYTLKAKGTEARARKLIESLHQAAQDLPLKELGEIIDLTGDACRFDLRDKNDPLRWLLIQAEQSVEINTGSYTRVSPTKVIAFTTWPGEGCEEANFGLCQYPATVETSEGRIHTQLSGWSWSSFCKTQYASDPNCGGVKNFLQCHLALIALLDQAKKLGCLAKVSDESHFWEKRDVEALVKEIGSWNEMIAAFGGKLKDLVGSGLEAPITEFPDFERLEAAGQNQLPPGFEELAKLISQVAKTA